MSDRLAELSDDAAHEIRTALRESREGVLIAQKRIDSLRKSPLVVNGTRATLESLRGKLGEAEELYITVFRQVNANYGDERAVGGRGRCQMSASNKASPARKSVSNSESRNRLMKRSSAVETGPSVIRSACPSAIRPR